MILKKLGLCLSMTAMLSSKFLCENFMIKAWADTNLIKNSDFENNETDPWELKVINEQDVDDESTEGTIFYFNNADMNNDGMINSNDLQELKAKFITDGDINADGKVNIKDYLLLTRYLMSPEGITLANPLAADLNNDGEINQQDADLLKDMILK